MGHRLPEHNGLCRNMHGHSYRMCVELAGELGADGMVMDYYELSKVVNEIISPFDHSFVVNENDNVVLNFLKENDFRYQVLPFDSTAENLCIHFANSINEKLPIHIKELKVRIYETDGVYAEVIITKN